MDLFILFLRIAITLTFLILAIFGPIAFAQLSTFIRTYKVAHETLKARVTAIEKQLGITSPDEDGHD